MPIFADEPATDPEFTDHGDVLEWLPHPAERGRRASHAIRGEDGLWIVDPIDVPELDARLEAFGDVAGVAVLANYHARDAADVADRYDCPVHVPAGADRVAARVDAPIEWFDDELGDSGFDLRITSPAPGWRETILVFDGDLYVPDLLGSAPSYTVGDERLAVYLLRRPFPPRTLFAGVEPERLFVGHGRAITEDAPAALRDALDGARRRFPRAFATHGPAQVRSMLTDVLW